MTTPTPTITLPTPTVTFPTPSTTISATSTATVWSTAVAKQHAAQIVAANTSALTTLTHVSPNAPLAQAQKALRDFADADDTAVHQLAAGAWPTAVRAKVDAYIAALDTESRTLRIAASKTSVEAMLASTGDVSAELTEVQSASSALTAALA